MDSLPYLIKTQICFALLWTFYQAVLRNSSRFGENRIFLLGTAAGSFLIPALTLPVYESAPMEVFVPAAAVETALPAVRESPYPLMAWIRGIYLAGVVILLSATAWHLGKIGRTFRRASVLGRHDSARILGSEDTPSAFTFFHCIFVNRKAVGDSELPHVLAHEMCHVRLRHGLDLAFARGLLIACWWNPFVWLWYRSLREIHEFQADREVLRKGYDTETYITSLIRNLSGMHPELVSGFSYSLIKKRLAMISRNKTQRRTSFRPLLSLPVLFALLALFSFTEKPARLESVAAAPVSDAAVQHRSDSVSYILNGKRISKAEKSALKPENIESIDVYKDRNTIIIRTKKGKGNQENPGSSSGGANVRPDSSVTLRVKRKEANLNGTAVSIFFDEKETDPEGGTDQTGQTSRTEASIESVSPEIRVVSVRTQAKGLEGRISAESRKSLRIVTDSVKSVSSPNASVIVVGGKEAGYVIDGKRVSPERMNDLDPLRIRSIRFDKETNTLRIETRSGNPKRRVAVNSSRSGQEEPVYLLDGREISQQEFSTLKSDEIESIDVRKDGKAVISIVTKKNKKQD